jgi:hypothetical protein
MIWGWNISFHCSVKIVSRALCTRMSKVLKKRASFSCPANDPHRMLLGQERSFYTDIVINFNFISHGC